MLVRTRPPRHALTLTEFLVVVAVVAALAVLLVYAAQAVRESAHRARCQNNLRQLAEAVHHFHGTHGTGPTYFGIYPPADGGVEPWRNRSALYGGWFAHLLPFIGEQDLHQDLLEEVQAARFNERQSNVVSPGVPPSGPVALTGTVRMNGKEYLTTATTWTEPGTNAVYKYVNHGIWIDEARGRRFGVLLCPSDPSPRSDPRAGDGLVYLDQSPPWGATNYLANWHAFGNGRQGLWTSPQPFTALTDGLSQTVLFAEGYAWCDDRGRIALYSWNYHNFGLTWALANAQLPPGGPRVSYPDGMPNTLRFQVRPLARSFADCPPGRDCCDNWRAQTGHAAMNVALADGSVRPVAAGVSQASWDRALLPRDGQSPGDDW